MNNPRGFVITGPHRPDEPAALRLWAVGGYGQSSFEGGVATPRTPMTQQRCR